LISRGFCEKQPAIEEIKKVSTAGKPAFAAVFGLQETVTESVKPREPSAKPVLGVQVGDLAIETYRVMLNAKFKANCLNSAPPNYLKHAILLR
jgi:hypothetical protein